MQQTPGTPLVVAGTPLDRSRFNAQSLQKLTEKAAQLPLAENDPNAWRQLGQRVGRDGELSAEEVADIREIGSNARAEGRLIRKELAASGFKDAQLAEQLVPFNVFETQLNRFNEAHRLSSAKGAVQALASSSFGATNLVAAYHAYANLPKSGLAGLVETMESSPGKLSFSGNKVEQVHQDELWRSMNRLLDKGLESADAGKPVEINAQYYELTSPAMIGKLADNAEAGNKVRVNVDPGRLIPFAGSTLNIDDIPDKMRALLQLADTPGDVAISAYPIARQLGSPTELMHRKGLRVGDEFLLSGMNANSGSGENVDAGYIIEGPAARKLVDTFARDVQHSKDTQLDDLYGKDSMAKFMAREDVRMGRRGLVSLVDSLTGPSPAGSDPARPKNYAELSGYFKERGFDLSKFIDIPKEHQGTALDDEVASNRGLPLTDYGKRRVVDLLTLVQREINSPDNLKKLDDVGRPSDAAKGTTVVSLADTPTEREALLIQSIQGAEKFVYVPAFVITRPIAAALAAKAEDMKQAGKDIDIRVLADPGVYPDGGTPNSWGVKFLEDKGIPVRWAALPRTDGHDRKVHAKELLTDKADFVGSTNFSNKGLRHNHEHSGVIHFDPSDPASMELQRKARNGFENLWDNYSVPVNSQTGAEQRTQRYQGEDRDYQLDRARNSVIRSTIRSIEHYEKDSAVWVAGQVDSLGLQSKVQSLIDQGYDSGNARLNAVAAALGPEAMAAGIQGLPSYQALHMANR